ncbi:DUF1152 domain-containing protein [Streptomyces sp. Da 82-17]|uniref:DUF1152 domain-containing protein n=1 Tax=Streptomyces sp. Da 82-17 TaxID=3377116 RepID=UPI0038D38032
MSDLLIAAGGGGDPLGATIAAHPLVPGHGRPAIATYAWERPEVDPTPGPLGAADFTGLGQDPAGPAFTPATRAVAPAGSTLPALAEALPARLLMLDPTEGLTGLARQIAAMAVPAAGRVRIVDIGGDILTRGDEPTLCSPLVDAYTLAACHLAGVTATVHVAGPGADGEIPQDTLLARLTDRYVTPGPTAADRAAAALRWHPTEASALFAAAIHGTRGTVRTVARAVPLTDASARVHELPLTEALDRNPVAQALLDQRPPTLDEAADLSHKVTGIHELDRERGRPGPVWTAAFPADRHRALAEIREAAEGADHATLRFAARTLGLTWHDIPALRLLLNAHGPLLHLT